MLTATTKAGYVAAVANADGLFELHSYYAAIVEGTIEELCSRG